MKKPSRSRLTIKRDVLRTLAVKELSGVVGGETEGTVTIITQAKLNEHQTVR